MYGSVDGAVDCNSSNSRGQPVVSLVCLVREWVGCVRLYSDILHIGSIFICFVLADEYPTDALVRKGTSSYNDSGLPDVDVITNLEVRCSFAIVYAAISGPPLASLLAHSARLVGRKLGA